MASQTRSAIAWQDSGGSLTFTGNAGALASSDDDKITAFDPVGAFNIAAASARSLGFSIPSPAVIEGITVSIERSQAGSGNITDNAFRLETDTEGSNTKQPGTNPPGADAILTLGSATDLWDDLGEWTPTPATINDATFRVHLEYRGFTAANDTIVMDHVQVTVFYSGPGAVKTCFSAFSTWVHKVCWIPEMGVQVTFKDRYGVPYFTCLYPGTTFADYEFFFVVASKGREIHRNYFRRPYIQMPLEV